MSELNGIILEAFNSGSHKRWVDELRRELPVKTALFDLPGRHWKWRMHGASVYFSKELKKVESTDFILTTDMTDLAVLKGLIPSKLKHTPCVLYMHENQLVYPWSEGDDDLKNQRNYHYAFINFTSMLAADQIWFNSEYHFQSWFDALPSFLKMYPDKRPTQAIEEIRIKSRVIPIGISINSYRSRQEKNNPPVILWNHRWEYDKNPEAFYLLCKQLEKRGINFRLNVVGEKSKNYPEIFDQMAREFVDRIINFGYIISKDEYIKVLERSDLEIVTSNQDFFGISAVEAIASGCTPLFPNRLAFPEHLPEELHSRCLYSNETEFIEKAIDLLEKPLNEQQREMAVSFVQRKYDWNVVIPKIEKAIEELLGNE